MAAGPTVGLLAEHGFAALVTVRRADRTTSLLFDTGMSPDAMVINADRLGVDLSAVQGVVLSHGHFDHAGGLAGLGRGSAADGCRWSCTHGPGPAGGWRSPAASPRSCPR